jgi:hypothetical protein
MAHRLHFSLAQYRGARDELYRTAGNRNQRSRAGDYEHQLILDTWTADTRFPKFPPRT